MDNNLKFWFDGFASGIDSLKQDDREKMFCECGKNCAKRWILNLYKDIFNKVNGDMDKFFEALNNMDGVRTEILESNKQYDLIFEQCVCSMHNEGYINSPHLCECSRQSVIFIMNSLVPDKEVDVEIKSTVLRGAEECRQTITIK